MYARDRATAYFSIQLGGHTRVAFVNCRRHTDIYF